MKNSRNRVLEHGLKKIGAISCECTDKSFWPVRMVRLFLKHRKVKNQYDVLFVAFPGQLMVVLAKLVTRKPVIFDPFISLYNTVVEDRQFHSKVSLAALWYFVLDSISLKMADVIIADTEAHAGYYQKKFGVRKEKFAIVPVGVREDLFFPLPAKGKNERFIVSFHGTYIPLHGIEYIIESAKLLKADESVAFRLLGTGQTLLSIKSLVRKYGLSNVALLEKRIPYEAFPEYISSADVCLGIFGKTLKAKMVVPNKVYECLAMGKPVITADTPAVREFFEPNKNIFTVDTNDPTSLVQRILELKDDRSMMERVALGGLDMFRKNFTSVGIAAKMMKDIAGLLSDIKK